jgi:uncharacterized protein
MSHSALYSGKVRHRRLTPVGHEFTTSLWMAWLDLNELEQVFAQRWFYGSEQIRPLNFRRRDHLGPTTTPLDTSVRDLVETETGVRPTGPIRLLTLLRHWGYYFNPIAVYYCYSSDGQQVQNIVAEVTNTPWGERHCYVLSPNADDPNSARWRANFQKKMHVSPFMGMELEYRWTCNQPDERLQIHLETYRAEQLTFDATLQLTRQPITTLNLFRHAVAYPWMTGQVWAAIYWQALKLWWKGVPYIPHPAQNPNESATSSTSTPVT